jgi:predicted nucleotidyltransferase
MDIQLAEKRTILRCVAGSESTGTGVGSGDRDELGVFIEPIERHVGFSTTESVVYRSAAARTGVADSPSEPGDLDLTLYTLRKFLSLCLKGNPTIISLLFAPKEQCLTLTKEGLELQALSPHLISKGTAGAFLGYMKAQRERLMGERGGKDVNRPELVKQYGYDTKYASHVIRLGIQGKELMQTGKLTLPLPLISRSLVIGIRKGQWKLDEVVSYALDLENEIVAARDESNLPKAPNVEAVESWMLDTYMEKWTQDDPSYRYALQFAQDYS